MWLIAEYKPVGLFSFKVGLATATGAKTLFLPTPFAIRTALLDAALRTQGITAGPGIFEIVKGLTIAALPPERVVVTNLFTKVLKPMRSDSQAETAMQRTIAFREYAYLTGCLSLAIGGPEASLEQISVLLPQINYFGKRGSFFQLLEYPKCTDELPENFIVLKGTTPETNEINQPTSFPLGIIQIMDDWGPNLNFDKVDIYSDNKIQLGRDRTREIVMLPYRLVQSSRGFSYYERG